MIPPRNPYAPPLPEVIDPEQLEKYHLERAHTVKTRARVRAAVRAYEAMNLGPLCSESIAKFRDARLAMGRAVNTVGGEVSKLSTYARWQGADVVVASPKKIRRSPVAWSKKELQRLFHEAEHTDRMIYHLPASVYFPALLWIAWESGERIGAMLGLEWTDIDLENRSIHYRAEIRKGGYADARWSISKRTARSIAALKAYGRPKPFDLGCRSTLWKCYTNLLNDAGLPNDRKSKFHRIRRSVATHVHLAGGDATLAMGHASPDVTWAHYIDRTQASATKKPNFLSWWDRLKEGLGDIGRRRSPK